MNEKETPFQNWTINQFHTITAAYRVQLNAVVMTCKEWAEGAIWQPEHTKTAIECLALVPKMPRYEGAVTAEEKAWYMEIHKPDWKGMREEAEREIKTLENDRSGISI